MRHSDTQCISFWQLSVRCQKIYHVAPEMHNLYTYVNDYTRSVFFHIIFDYFVYDNRHTYNRHTNRYNLSKYGCMWKTHIMHSCTRISHFWSYMVYLLTPYWKLSKTNTLSIRMSHFVLKNVLYTNLYSKSPFH